jgi:FkbM family methyltransferase
MLKWFKNKVKNKLRYFFRTELEIIKNELHTEYKKAYFELRWQEILQDKSIEKVTHFIDKKIFINLYKNNYLSNLIFSNQFEEDIVSFITSNLNNGDCFIDIGANIGFFSLITSSVVSENGLVLAFEPTDDTFIKLDENIRQNGLSNIKYYRVALSDYEGTAPFNVSVDGHDAFNSFSLPQHGNEYKPETVDVKMLDSFYDSIKAYKNRILLKVDVEGWEYNVIKGAVKVFRELNPVIIIEFNDENTKNSPHKCRDVYTLIQSYGYDLFSLDNGQLLRKENENYFNYQNLIAKKASRLI